MCANGEQISNLNKLGRVLVLLMLALMMSGYQQERSYGFVGMGAVVEGENIGGMAESLHIVAPPHWQVVFSGTPGSFWIAAKA